VLFGPPAPSDTDGPEATKLRAPGHLHATRAPAETRTSLPATRAAGVTSAGCLAEVRTGETRQAEGCFARLAAGPSADAELALYELARLRHDALGDDAGAARALQEYGRRFPHGTLRTEAASSSFEVLSALGRYDEALAASRVALAESSGDQQARLRFLRGRVMQTHLRDCAGAINEYAAAERGLGPRRAEAAFYRGQCLEQLGRRDEAVGAYRTAAAAPDATTAIRAKARLEELAR
jgi:tetratricopeptide (TPR) repeat protein